MKNNPLLFLKTYGIKLFIIEGLVLFLSKINIFNKLRDNLICKKHKCIISYLEKEYKYIIDKYKNSKSKDNKPSNKIWVYWYQGIENAPDIVKMCIKSMRDNLYDSEVIILTKDNMDDYIDLPAHLKEKHENGIINRTNFSDIVRMFILKTHGGFWFDATILVTKKLSSKELNKVKTIKFHNNEKTSISNGLWCGFFLGNMNHSFFEFMCEFFTEFWIDKNIIIDYFLIDYVIRIAYKNIKVFKKDVDNNIYNNENIHKLCGYLSSEYDKDIYKEILNDNYIHKLSFKVPLIDEVDGKKTFYKVVKEKFYEK